MPYFVRKNQIYTPYKPTIGTQTMSRNAQYASEIRGKWETQDQSDQSSCEVGPGGLEGKKTISGGN